MTTNTLDRDLIHLKGFSESGKEKIMRAIMERPGEAGQICVGANCYENALIKLHAKSYQLIDLNLQETAFTWVWYREIKSCFGLRTAKSAVMLVWESTGNGEQTMSRT